MPDLSDYVVAPSDTIQHAMEKIDRRALSETVAKAAAK